MYGQTNHKRFAVVWNDRFVDCATRLTFSGLSGWAAICCARKLHTTDLNVVPWDGKIRARLKHIGVGRRAAHYANGAERLLDEKKNVTTWIT